LGIRNERVRTELQEQDIDVWVVPLDKPDLNSHSSRILSAEELERAGRFLRDGDRARFIAAHHALRKILAEYVGILPDQLRFEINEFGKPHLRNIPHFDFNMSHSGLLGVIAVRVAKRVGVDLEEIRAETARDDIAGRFFSKGEAERLRGISDPERVRAFYQCWTRKEAYLKALGRGISDEDLAAAEVSFGQGETPAIVRRVAQGDNALAWCVKDLRLPSGYIGALVAEGGSVRVRERNWSELG
jgi:4'-phosphopantetheinyl transferase